MCVSVSVCVAMPPGITLLRQNVTGRQGGRVTEHIKTHTHMHTQYAHSLCLLAGQPPHRKVPMGASQMPPPTECPDGAAPVKNERGKESKGTVHGAGGEVGTQTKVF